MAQTTLATGNALTRKAWAEKLFRDSVKESYFMPMATEGTDSLVTVKTELEKEKGDRITIGIRMRLVGAGVSSGTSLEGQEEALTTYSFNLTLEQYRHATRDDGAMTRKRASFDLPAEAKSALQDWGSERIDSRFFSVLQASPTSIYYTQSNGTPTRTGTLATATGAITATDVVTPKMLSFMRVAAKTGRNRAQVPLRPVRVNGRDYYVYLAHPDSIYDLKNDATYAQARREAETRGQDNPIFTGALGVWDGIVVHEHENINIYTNGGTGSDVPYCTNVLMGAQALVWGWGERSNLVYKTFDYDDQQGWGWGFIGDAAKTVFNSNDYGSLMSVVARTRISDL